MYKKDFSRQVFSSDTTLLTSIAVLKLLLHFITNNQLLGYGYFRDEFYYLVCAERLDFGYVDHPPFAIILLSVNRWLLGDSIFALRLLPAVVGAVTVFLTGLIVRQLEGGKLAQSLAALAVVIAPVHLVLNGGYSPNAFEILWWVLCAYLLIMLLKHDKPQLWLWIGLIAGIGLQTKHTMLLFGLGMVAGLVLTPARKYLRNKWLWLGGTIAFLIALPNLIWQVRYGWPSLQFYANATLYKNVATPPSEVFLNQILVMNPLTFPVWLAGLYYYFFVRDGQPYRMLGWIYVTVLAILVIGQSSRPDRAAGVYPMLWAAGTLVLERVLQRSNNQCVFAAAAVGLFAVGGVAVMPVGIPILPPETTAQLATALGAAEVSFESGKSAALPQYFADRFGWEEMVATVAAVYHDLQPDEQAKVVILTANYGEAGAIDFFGGAYNLPKAISGHNNYFLWGPGDSSGEIVIALGYSREDLLAMFDEVEQVTMTQCGYCMNYENNLPIYVARRLKFPVQDVWSQIKHYE